MLSHVDSTKLFSTLGLQTQTGLDSRPMIDITCLLVCLKYVALALGQTLARPHRKLMIPKSTTRISSSSIKTVHHSNISQDDEENQEGRRYR